MGFHVLQARRVLSGNRAGPERRMARYGLQLRGPATWRFVVIRRTIAIAGGILMAFTLSSGIALAGQPGASCGAAGATLSPAGFDTQGFANAEAQYAGSTGTHSLANANSDHAVSQYDIACVHYTAAHG